MDIQPTFEVQPTLLLAGCPQFGETGKVCPGAAWDRLFSIRLQAGLPKIGPVGYGVLVLPPEFPNNHHQHYYFASFEAAPETEGVWVDRGGAAAALDLYRQTWRLAGRRRRALGGQKGM